MRAFPTIGRLAARAAGPALTGAVVLTGCGAADVASPVGASASAAATTSESAPASESASASPSAAASSDMEIGAGEAWIAYQWLAGSGDGIYLVRPDGTGQHQLVPDVVGSHIHPDWSPDGSQIAFISRAPDGHSELWVVDADGTDATSVYSCQHPCNEIHFPDWSPDGTSIYFSQNADVPSGEEMPRTFSIARLDLEGGEVHLVLSHDDGMVVEQSRVSPDGAAIAYMGGSEAIGGTAVFTMPAEGGAETQLTDYEMFAAHPDWTPDGRIVFHTENLLHPEEPGNLFVMDADGASLEQLTHFTEAGERAFQPRNAPDGSGIAFTREEPGGPSTRRMAFLEFGAPEPGWLTPEPLAGTHAQLRPGS